MPLAIDDGSAASHRQAHDGAVGLVPDTAVFQFQLRHQFRKEELFIGPVLHVEVAVLGMMDIRSAGVRHNDDRRNTFAGGDQFIRDHFHQAFFLPGPVIIRKPMEEINHRITVPSLVKTVRQIDIVPDGGAEHLAPEAVRDHFPSPGRKDRHQSKEQYKQDSFHIKGY